MTKIETTVARHDEKIKEMDKRIEERRKGEISLFGKLDKINENISGLKTDFAGWKGRAAVWGTVAMIFISAGISLAVKLLSG